MHRHIIRRLVSPALVAMHGYRGFLGLRAAQPLSLGSFEADALGVDEVLLFAATSPSFSNKHTMLYLVE